MPFPKDGKYTAEEFFALIPEDDDKMYELYNGEIVSQASPSRLHQRIAMKISATIDQYISAQNGKCEVYSAPTDVKLDDDIVVIPDVFITCDNDKWDEQKYNGAPDFIIEIVSSNRSDDFVRKLELYQKYGVREYWIVDPESKRVVVYYFKENNNIKIYNFDQNIPVGIYQKNEIKLEINIEQLLA